MSLSVSSLKAVHHFVNNKVVPLEATDYSLIFKVGKEETFFDLRKKEWFCTCRHEVFRGSNLKKKCYHIKSCILWLHKKKKVAQT